MDADKIAAPREVHEAAREALAQDIRAATGIGWSVHVATPQVAPAIDAAYAAGVAAGRRQAADDIRATHDTWSQLGKLPQSYLDGVADAAGIADPAPAEPVEGANRG